MRLLRQAKGGVHPTTEAEGDLLFPELATIYAKDWIARRSPSFRDQKILLGRLENYLLPVLGATPAAEVTREHFQSVIRSCKKNGLRQNSIARVITILKAILNFGEAEGYLPEHSVPKVKVPAGTSRKSPPLTPSELERVWEHASPHIRRAITLGVALGPRPGELVAIRWLDVNWVDKTIRIWTSKHVDEGSPWRDLDLTEDLYQQLRVWQAEDGPGVSHIVHYHGRPVKDVGKAWQTAVKAAGIGRYVRFYTLRHTFATQVLASGQDLQTVASIMGTSVGMITRHYQHVLDHRRKEVVESAPKIGMAGDTLGGYSGPITTTFLGQTKIKQ